MFSSELVGILTVGVALATLVPCQGARLERRIDLLAGHMNERFRRIEERLRDLGECVARLEGKIDLIEGVIVRRNEPSGAAAE